MMSIMQLKDGTCYLCKKLNNDSSLKFTHEHHVIFGWFGAGRALSEKFGLKVYLCYAHHMHDGGAMAVHRNKTINQMLCEDAQRAFDKRYPNLSFREIFGKNYISEENIENIEHETTIEQGFIPLES